MHWLSSLSAAVLLQACLGWYWYASGQKQPTLTTYESKYNPSIVPAADQIHNYINFIRGKRLGLVVNHTSVVGNTHLVDTLLDLGCTIQKVFAPEHGFRGEADAGKHIRNEKVVTPRTASAPRTKLTVVSLYGKNKRPSASSLANIDLMIFDMQDVGARFYTYTSTMTYVMEACAENGIPLLILDRPNPNGHYIDGPILTPDQHSFVGLHPVPIVHGLTVAEYARMINGEGWLEGGKRCELHHVQCLNYSHSDFYELPVAPSPNLPNMRSIYLYPSLCWFEGTPISVGRGTTRQFQCYGHPDYEAGSASFTPVPRTGANSPKHQDKTCQGHDLSQVPIEQLQQQKLNLTYLLDLYNNAPEALKASFFNKNNFFDKLAGTAEVQALVRQGTTPEELRQSWAEELEAYRQLRKKYLLYPDFE